MAGHGEHDYSRTQRPAANYRADQQQANGYYPQQPAANYRTEQPPNGYPQQQPNGYYNHQQANGYPHHHQQPDPSPSAANGHQRPDPMLNHQQSSSSRIWRDSGVPTSGSDASGRSSIQSTNTPSRFDNSVPSPDSFDAHLQAMEGGRHSPLPATFHYLGGNADDFAEPCDPTFYTPGHRYTHPTRVHLFGDHEEAYRLFDSLAGEWVIIRKIAAPFVSDASMADPSTKAKRLYRELRFLIDARHANAIRLLHAYTHTTANGTVDVYLVMENVGATLDSFIKGPKNICQVARVLQQLLTATKYLHSCGLIHRGLHPGNIAFGEGECVKLTNFSTLGGATRCPFQTKNVSAIRYCAPEMLIGEEYDKEVDMWPLGCILAEMLLGRSPHFGGTDNYSQLMCIIRKLGSPNVAFINQMRHAETRESVRLMKCPSKDWALEFSDANIESLLGICSCGGGHSASSARQLLSRMLVIEPEERICVRAALDHEFMRHQAEGQSSRVYGGLCFSEDTHYECAECSIDEWRAKTLHELEKYWWRSTTNQQHQ